MKFLKNYKLTMELEGGRPVVVSPPTFLQFHVERNINDDPNLGSIELYNLPQDTRHQLYRDWYVRDTDHRSCKLEAGYGDDLHTIFSGEIQEAHSEKNGPDWVSRIEAQSGDMARVCLSLGKGTSIGDLIVKALGNTNLTRRIKIPLTQTLQRGVVLSHTPNDVLGVYTEGRYFVDNGIVHVLDDEDYVVAPPLYLGFGTDTPLLGMPRRTKTFLQARTLFAPRAALGQMAVVSDAEGIYSGTYKVTRITHTGSISTSDAGSASTTLELYVARRI